MSALTVLVTGGRRYSKMHVVGDVLGRIHAELGIGRLIQGGATGADALALRWAFLRRIDRRTYSAKWKRADGTVNHDAGFERNVQMLELEDVDLVVAFPGGNGTLHMSELALERVVPLLEVIEDEQQKLVMCAVTWAGVTKPLAAFIELYKNRSEVSP